MKDIYRSYGADGIKILINTGQIGVTIAKLAQLELESTIPGAKVSSTLFNRVPAKSPVIGIDCQ